MVHSGPRSRPWVCSRGPLWALLMDISKESCQNIAVEERKGGGRGGWFEVGPGWRRNRDGENLSPRDHCAATPETCCERSDTGMGGHPNLTQGLRPIGSLCRT